MTNFKSNLNKTAFITFGTNKCDIMKSQAFQAYSGLKSMEVVEADAESEACVCK